MNSLKVCWLAYDNAIYLCSNINGVLQCLCNPLPAIEKTFVIANSSVYDSFVDVVLILPWETVPFSLDAILHKNYFFSCKVLRLIHYNCQKLLFAICSEVTWMYSNVFIEMSGSITKTGRFLILRRSWIQKFCFGAVFATVIQKMFQWT